MNEIVETAINLSRKHHMQFVNLSALPKIPESTLELMGIERAIRHKAIPIHLDDGTVTIAISDPDDIENVEQIRAIMAPKDVTFYVAAEADLLDALSVRYSDKLLESRA